MARDLHGKSSRESHHAIVHVVAVITLGAHAAFAQSEPHSAVSFFGGAASGASDTGAALGGSLLVDLHERVSIEGQGTYLDRGDGADAVTAHVLRAPSWSLAFPRDGVWEARSFTDSAPSVGGGFRFNVTDRVMLRPDVRALVIFADGDTHTLATFGVHLGYRF